MELSLFLGQLFGLSLAIFALIGLLRPSLIVDAMADFSRQPLIELLFGFVGIVVGLAIILTHNVWAKDWTVVITLVGWAALLKGVMFLLVPQKLMDFGRTVYQTQSKTRTVLLVALVVGLYIAWKGFGN